MKKVLLAVFFCLNVVWVLGQTNGAYRSRQTGDWNQVTTWQVFNSGWHNLESPGAGGFQNSIPSQLRSVITISSGTMVTVPSGFEVTVDQLEFGPTAILQVAGNGILNITNGAGHDARLYNDGTNFSQLLVSGFIRLLNNATIVNDNYAGTVLPASNATTVNTYKVLNGGLHIHASADALPFADWQIGSTLTFYATNTNPTITDPSIQFYSFHWDGRAQTANLSFNGNLRNVTGSLVVSSTNGRVLSLGASTNYTLNIGGALRISGNSNVNFNQTATVEANIGGGFFVSTSGTIYLSTTGTTTLNVADEYSMSSGTLILRSSLSLAGTTNLNLSGDFSQTNGSIYRGGFAGSSNINFVGTGTTSTFSKTGGSIFNSVNYTVATGKTLDLGTSTLTGSGTITLSSGATLHVKSLDAGGAIQNNTTGGNIRISGARIYQAGSTIVYDGAGPQFMGTGHPAGANTTINNTSNVSLVSNVTINGALNQIEGVLGIGSNTLTMGGAYSRTNGYFGISSTSNVIINGSGNFGPLILSPVQFQNNPMNNLTINRSGGTVFLGNSVIVGGAFNHNNGVFNLGQFNAFTLTLRGNFAQSGGASLAVFPGSSLIIEGTGTMPSNVNLVGTDFSTLTMDRPSRSFNSSSPMTLVNLNLLNGTVNNAALNITMAPNGLVTRESGGAITSVLGAISTFDVIYNIDTNISTGNELPFDLTRLGNLTKQGPATLQLTHPIQVNKTFTVASGTFNVGTTNNVAVAEDLIVTGTLLVGESKLSFIGSGPQEIDVATPTALFDLEVNQTTASTVELSPTTVLNVQNSLAVNSGSVLMVGNEQLTLLSTPTRTANVNPLAPGASIAGSVIVQRYLPKAVVPRRQYHYLASPVVGSTLADWGVEVPLGRVYRWHEPSQSYQQINAATPVTNGVGFLVDVADVNPRTYDSRGPLAQGTINTPLSAQATVGTSKGMNLVGNPYASAIDWDNITVPPNANDAIYLVDNFGNSNQGTGTEVYVSYVDGVGTPLGYGGTIAQGQAFFVFTTANSTLTFTENAKILPTNTQFYRKPEIPNVLRITLDGDGLKDETVIRLRDGASDEFDGKFDAFKLPRKDPTIASLTSDNVKTAINAIETPKGSKIIPLALDSVQLGSFTISFVGIESFEPHVNISLLDMVSKTSTDLRKEREYSFTVTDKNKGLISNRFKIIIGRGTLPIENAIASMTLPEDTDSEGVETIAIFPNPATDKVIVQVKTENNNLIATLVNTQGVELGSKKLLGDGIKQAEFDMLSYAGGVYNILIKDGQKITIKRIAKIE